MRLTTTLNLLREAGVVVDRYRHLIKALGGTKFDHDAPINLLTILEHNGVGDVKWVLEQGATVEDCATLLAEYKSQRDPLWAEYQRQRVPLDAEYQRQRDLLDAEYQRQRDLLDAEYQRQRDLLDAEYQRQRAPLSAEYERQRDLLLAALLGGSDFGNKPPPPRPPRRERMAMLGSKHRSAVVLRGERLCS